MISCVSSELCNNHCLSMEALSSEALIRMTGCHLQKTNIYVFVLCADTRGILWSKYLH